MPGHAQGERLLAARAREGGDSLQEACRHEPHVIPAARPIDDERRETCKIAVVVE
jgi:hypothetical protein